MLDRINKFLTNWTYSFLYLTAIWAVHWMAFKMDLDAAKTVCYAYAGVVGIIMTIAVCLPHRFGNKELVLSRKPVAYVLTKHFGLAVMVAMLDQYWLAAAWFVFGILCEILAERIVHYTLLNNSDEVSD